jgi:hypothetical protein
MRRQESWKPYKVRLMSSILLCQKSRSLALSSDLFEVRIIENAELRAFLSSYQVCDSKEHLPVAVRVDRADLRRVKSLYYWITSRSLAPALASSKMSKMEGKGTSDVSKYLVSVEQPNYRDSTKLN